MSVSVIVDGFDPWERIEPILAQIREEAGQHVEVCLAISYLMDTESDICRKYGASLFGSNFFCLRTDNLSVFKTRLQAQKLLHGQIFLYLSPFVAPAQGTIAALLEHTAQKRVSSSTPLAYLYPNGICKRTIAHGFACDGKRIVNLCAGKPANRLKNNNAGIIANPYCFCSPGSYYETGDDGEAFWQAHINASERHGYGCVSLASTAATLYEDNFSTWIRLSEHALFSGNSTISQVAKVNGLKVWLTPYGEYRLEDENRQPAANNDKKSQEEIFWDLLVDPRPELIALASAKAPLKPLQRLAQETLQKIAKVSWEDALAVAKHSLYLKDPDWQSLEDWEKTNSGQKRSLYPDNEISLWKAIKTGKTPFSTLGVLYQIFKYGLTSSARHN